MQKRRRWSLQFDDSVDTEIGKKGDDVKSVYFQGLPSSKEGRSKGQRGGSSIHKADVDEDGFMYELFFSIDTELQVQLKEKTWT